MASLALTILQGIADDLVGRRMSFETFCKKYLRHHFPLPDSAMHRDLKAKLQEIVRTRNARENWRAPRGNAKSTILSLAYPLYCVCFGLERYIILVSDTHTQAKQFLSDIKLELEQNEELKRDFPVATRKGLKWTDDEIVTGNNIMITSLGMRGKIRGRKFGSWRPTLIIIDDPENDESVVSPRQRERARTWLEKSCVAAGVPDYTNIVIVGTVLNGDCLVEVLAGKPGWTTRTYSAVMTWPKNMDLWDQWEQLYYDSREQAEAFYLANKVAMEEGAVVLWPSRESLYSLMLLRAEDHLVFESEKQNAAVNPANCRFPQDWFENIWYDELPEDGFVSSGACDPSVGRDAKKGDYSPIVWAYWKKGHRYLYIDCDMGRRPPTVLVDIILKLHMVHLFKLFGWESNGFQLTIGESLSEKSAKAGTHLPVVLVNHTEPKERRIERLGPHLQMGNLKFKRGSKGAMALVRQIMLYGVEKHDDGPDALELLIEIIRQSTARGRKPY